MYKKIEDLKNALKDNKIKAINLIESLQNSGSQFQAHPLGFISCTFLRENTETARLHIWTPTPQTIQSPSVQIHDHVFQFTSWILSGSITNTTFTPDGQGDKYAIYTTQYSENKSTLHKSKKIIQLKLATSTTHLTGSKYTISAGQFHKSERAEKNTTITLLITKKTRETSPLVAGPIDGPLEYEYQRRNLSNQEIKKIMLDIES